MIPSTVNRSMIGLVISSSSSTRTAVSRTSTTGGIRSLSSRSSYRNSIGTNRNNSRSHSSSSLLTPEEKREIFLRKSKELHQAMYGVLGERNAAKQTIAKVASVSSSKQQQAATATTASNTNTNNNNNNSRQSNFKQAMLNVGVSFVTVVLAAQVMKTSVAKRKADISLEAALEILEEKRILLEKVQNESDLRNLAKQCVDIIQQSDRNGTNNNNNNNSTGLKTKSSSWGGWLLGSSVNDNDDVNLFRDDDDDTNEVTNNPNSYLEERIFRTLSNHVHQVVGDAAYTNDEKDRREFQKLVNNNNNNNSNNESEINFTNNNNYQQQQQEDIIIKDESEKLLNELVQEQLSSTIEEDGTTQKIIKRRVFQI